MRFHFLTIPAFDPDAAQDALNAFCAQHRIVASDRHFVDRGVDSFWAVCVTWVEGSAAAFPTQAKRERVDYREVLGEADFAVYSELRRLRKQLAEREGVPAYAIFTNEQLAAMVQRRVATAQGLGAIEGVGEARVDKFGEVFLAALTRLLPGAGRPAAVDHEANPGQP